MKKQMMKMTLAVTTVLGAGSIPAGSLLLGSIGAGDQASATVSAVVDVANKALQTLLPNMPRAHEEGAGAMVGTADEADMVLIASHQASGLSPSAENGSQDLATLSVLQAPGAVFGAIGAPGTGAAFGGAGGVSRDLGGAAGAVPLVPVPQSPISVPTPKDGVPVEPAAMQTPALSALPPSVINPESGPGTTPSEIVAIVFPDPVTPDLGTQPYEYVLDDLPSLPPSQGGNGPLDDPTPTTTPITVAEDVPPAAPNNTVPEPSTLALLGIAAIALRRRMAKA